MPSKSEDSMMDFHQAARRRDMRKWTKYRRLSKSKNEGYRSPQLAIKWYSSGIQPSISPEQEEQLIQEYEQRYAKQLMDLNIRQSMLQSRGSSLLSTFWAMFQK